MTSSHDPMRQVLQRAAELEQTAPLSQTDVDTLLHAADEVGIPRAAVERALRERRVPLPRPPAIGQLVFARSADDNYYVAEVKDITGEDYTVRFVRGGEGTLAIEDIRPCSLLPGERVQVKWPNWGTWTCSVVSYDADNKHLTVSDGWSETRVFSIADVWIHPRKTGIKRNKLRAAVLGAAAAGFAIGAAMMSMLLA